MKLLIVGNGFDLAHSIRTSYGNFRTWIIETYGICIDEICTFNVPEYNTNYKRLESYSPKEFATFFFHLLEEVLSPDKNWRNFEESLADVNWMHIFEDVEKGYDKGGDENPFYISDNYLFEANKLNDSAHILENLFSEWIHSIDEQIKCKPLAKVKNLLGHNPLCLSFNYTSTIEKVYEYNKVCHIHGYASKYEPLLFGHGGTKNSIDDEMDFTLYDAYDVIEGVRQSFRKNIEYALKIHKDFFESLSDIDEIYIFGHSLGDVDYPYFRLIIRLLGPNLPIYLSYKNDDEFLEKRARLIQFGFKGPIVIWK